MCCTALRMFSLGERLSEAGHAAPLMMCCLPADAAAYQQEEDQRQTPPSASWHVTDTVTSPTKPVDDISFPVLTGPTSARAASSSPDRLAPTTPDQLLAPLPACKVNPISNFHNLLASQEEEEEAQDALASFHQLLISQELSKQDRLSRFHELLASQELNKDGEPLVSLASRVRTMASQLDALQKRTKVPPPLHVLLHSEGSVSPGIMLLF